MTPAAFIDFLEGEDWNFSTEVRFNTLPPQSRYGVIGRYTDESSSAWGGTIWSMDTAYKGGISGANSANTSVYGLRWLRASHANAATSIGEGLYVYQNGSLKGGIGTGGIYSSTTVYATTGVNIGNLTDSTLTRLSAAKLGVEGKALFKHAGSYVSGEVTFSTGAASGGTSGDIHFQYTA